MLDNNSEFFTNNEIIANCGLNKIAKSNPKLTIRIPKSMKSLNFQYCLTLIFIYNGKVKFKTSRSAAYAELRKIGNFIEKIGQ